MNQQTGDPDEVSGDYTFKSCVSVTVVTLFDAKVVR